MEIAFINCTKTKKPYKCSAEEMYSGSQLFNASKNYAKKLGVDEIYILSCKHGLLARDTIIEPYDVTLQGSTKDEQIKFGMKVYEQLLNEPWFEKVTKIHFLTSHVYHWWLIQLLDVNDVDIIVHGEGLGMGYKVQHFKNKASRQKKLF